MTSHWLVVKKKGAHTACRIPIEAEIGSNQPQPEGLTYDGQKLPLAKTRGEITCPECRAVT